MLSEKRRIQLDKLHKLRKGMKHTEEAKNKIRIGNTGKSFSREYRNKLRKAKLGRKLTDEHRKNIGKKRDKNGNWQGGKTKVSFLVRNCVIYKKWRQEVYIKDNFTCQRCKKSGGSIEAHHKKSFSKLLNEAKEYMPLLTWYDACLLYTPLWDVNNGITYCKDCHKKV